MHVSTKYPLEGGQRRDQWRATQSSAAQPPVPRTLVCENRWSTSQRSRLLDRSPLLSLTRHDLRHLPPYIQYKIPRHTLTKGILGGGK